MLRRTFAFMLTVILITLSVLSPRTAPPVHAQSNAWEPYRYFPQTGHNIGLSVKEFYDTHGALETFGLPLTELFTEADGRQVQYFERARFEVHPENRGTDFYILLTLLGTFFTQDRLAEPAFQRLAAPPTPESSYFPESGHTLSGGFREYWRNNGGLYAFGFPISEEFQEVSPTDGNTYTVQYFERARFEHHPENAGTKWEVQLGLLGSEFARVINLSDGARAPVTAVLKIGEATTYYRGSTTERVSNIARAADRFKGITVKAGTTFSFNANVGDVSADSGFEDGYAIVGGQLEKVVGGGLCQVSTTMFRAVFNAGLPIVERYPHTYVVYYYENILGFDATVFIPQVDFKWRNDLTSDIFMWTDTDVSSGRVTFSLWGYGDGRTTQMDGPYVSNKVQPGQQVWQYDKTLGRGQVEQLVHGRPGMDVVLYRLVTKASTTTREKFFTRYLPWEDFYIYGPGVTPPAGAKVIAPRYP